MLCVSPLCDYSLPGPMPMVCPKACLRCLCHPPRPFLSDSGTPLWTLRLPDSGLCSREGLLLYCVSCLSHYFSSFCFSTILCAKLWKHIIMIFTPLWLVVDQTTIECKMILKAGALSDSLWLLGTSSHSWKDIKNICKISEEEKNLCKSIRMRIN